MRNVVVALITRTVRGIPSELSLDGADGMPTEGVVSFDNLSIIPKTLLSEPITRLPAERTAEACSALDASTGAEPSGSARPGLG